MTPNILVLMCDQLQAQALYDSDICRTPNLDRIRARGVRFARAYTPNPVCSPARASLMTGKLPHNHNVLWVTHTMPHDQVSIREGLPHFAQDLVRAGYTTSYVGKWHVEPAERPTWYGWKRDFSARSQAMAGAGLAPSSELISRLDVEGEGYRTGLLAGVTTVPPAERSVGAIVARARDELGDFTKTPDDPWCLFVSVPEPHDPYVAGKEAFDSYEGWSMEAPANWHDELAGRPRIYQRAARPFAGLSDDDRRFAARCYYASVTEIDVQFGLVLDDLEQSGALDDTVIVMLTDHGDYLGAHGMYCKNFGAWEEAYGVPLVIAGPGLGSDGSDAGGLVSRARVGTHAVFPSILHHYGIRCTIDCDAPLFDDVLAAASGRPAGGGDERPGDASAGIRAADANHTDGLAEYFGGRLLLTQRVYYHDDWKLVWNGFDDHEFYDLADDPGETRNLAGADGPALSESGRVARAYREVTARFWSEIERTGDATLLNSQYIGLRASEIGPEHS